MAESIHTTIDRGNMDINHGTNTITIDLPESLQVFSNKTEGEDLLDVFNQLSSTEKIGLIHSGLASEIINVRAVVRSVAGEREDINTGKMIKNSFTGKEKEIERKIEEYSFTPKKRPGVSAQNKVKDMITALKDQGLSAEEILIALTAK